LTAPDEERSTGRLQRLGRRNWRLLFLVAATVILGLFVVDYDQGVTLLLLVYALTWVPWLLRRLIGPRSRQ
jgi:hypothetical protein